VASKYNFFIILLAGCGGGGEGGGGSTPTVNGTISGTAIKGPVANATVTAFSIRADGTKGIRLDTGQTDGQGNFSISVSDYSGSVFMEITGGHYRDDATGNDMNMFQGDRMTCAIPFMPSNSVMSGIQITPLTSMAQSIAQHMAGGMNKTTITEANSAVGQYFEVNDIVHTPSMTPLVDGSGAGTKCESIIARNQWSQTRIIIPNKESILNLQLKVSDAMVVPGKPKEVHDGL
jgi:hypothetical protein